MPEHLHSDIEYDKWCNIIINDSKRLRGEMFYDDTIDYCNLLKLNNYPVIYDGIYNKSKIINLLDYENNSIEYVIRSSNEFSYKEYKNNIAKYIK